MSNTFFSKGNQAFRNDKYQEALKNYLLAKKENPEFSKFVDTNIALIKRRAPDLLQQITLHQENVTPTIDYQNKTINQIIQLAQEAMGQDDWVAAYHCWNSLLGRTDEALSVPMLLRISKELFALDAFSEAEAALQRAEKCDPKHPRVLTTRAQQYYYHCYSSWLMLVTENEPDWYKADGLDKRPDWRTACELIERAEKAAPRNNLRRYVQAYLLLAEEAWGQQQPTQACEALGIALKAIGPNALDKSLTQAIFAAVEQFRTGGNEQDPYQQALQEYLQALPLELLAVPDWLCLNDILNWNGLLLCGYVAKEKAVDLAIAQGRTNPKHKEILKTALKAALDRGDTALADEFLSHLKAMHPDALDVRELDSCCELMKGNLDAFRTKWPHPITPAQQRLRDYLKGKSVAVVGPAPTGTMDGEEIDSFDVVVRMNWRETENMPDAQEFGKVIHSSLINSHSVRLMWHRNIKIGEDFDITNIFIRKNSYRVEQIFNKKCFVNSIRDYPGVFYKSLNSVPAVIFFLLLNNANFIKIFKINFYGSKNIYYGKYKKFEIDNSKIRSLQNIFINHDLTFQRLFIKKLIDNRLISFKDKYALAYSNISYLDNLSSIRKPVNQIARGRVVVLSSGIYSTIIALYILKQKGIIDCDVFLYSKEITNEFITQNVKFNNSSNIIKNTLVLNNFISARTLDLEKFNSIYADKIEIILTPGLNHWMLRAFLEVHSNANKILYEEGMGSYEQLDFDDGCGSRINEAYYIDPLNIAHPLVLDDISKQVFKIDKYKFKNYLSNYELSVDVKNNKNNVLILGMGLHLYNFTSLLEEVNVYVKIINSLLSKGYHVIFKGHPREKGITANKLYEIFNNKIEVIENDLFPVEVLSFVRQKNFLSFVIGGPSTALYNISWLYGIKCYTIKDFFSKVPFNCPEFNIWSKTLRLFDVFSLHNNQLNFNSSRIDSPLISIVIPAYNVESYIDKCLNSVLNQSYKNLDVIVVNDGSSDKTGLIADSYARNNKIIRIINQNNKGLSAARNVGLAASIGEYFCFLDGDDWLSYGAIERLINVALATNAEVIRSSFYSVPNKKRPIKNNLLYELGLSNKVLNALDDEKILVDMYISSCIGLFKKTDDIYRIKFPEGLKYEDNYYYWMVTTLAKKIAFVDIPTYFYRKREGSITSIVGKNDIDIVRIYEEIYEDSFGFNKSEEGLSLFKKRFEKVAFSHLKRVINTEYYNDFCIALERAIKYFKLNKNDFGSYFSGSQVDLLFFYKFEALKKELSI